jgi:hypothetical protein
MNLASGGRITKACGCELGTICGHQNNVRAGLPFIPGINEASGTGGTTSAVQTCPKCGMLYVGEMHVCIGYTCPFCSGFVGQGQMHFCPAFRANPLAQGWQCPKCLCVWAPSVKGCERCNP